MEAELIIGICDRFHKLPSEVMKESAVLLRYMEIVGLGKREEVEVG